MPVLAALALYMAMSAPLIKACAETPSFGKIAIPRLALTCTSIRTSPACRHTVSSSRVQAINREAHDRQIARMPPGLRQPMLQPVVQQGAIGQSCQGIVERGIAGRLSPRRDGNQSPLQVVAIPVLMLQCEVDFREPVSCILDLVLDRPGLLERRLDAGW